MRNIDLIVIHCSDSDLLIHDNVETIRQWHVYERGFNDIGYHYVITKDGTCHVGRDLYAQGAHCKGYNRNSIGICLTGSKNFSEAQFQTCRKVIDELVEQFGLELIDVVPHRELNKEKTCPNFNIYEKVLSKH